MNESFKPTKEVSQNEKLPLNITNRFSRLKEYIKTLPEHVRKGGALTVLFLMGAFSTAEAQNVDSNYNKIIDDLRSGNIKVENAADYIYSSYKENNKDLTFSYVEYSSHVENKKESIDIKSSGPEIISDQKGDTLSMGNCEAMEFSVIITADYQLNNGGKFNEESRFLSAVKPYGGEIKNGDSKRVSSSALGKTKQEAIISAIAGLAGFKNSEISANMLSEDKESISGGEEQFSSNYLQVISSETKKTILENVKIVVTQTVGGFSVEAFCN